MFTIATKCSCWLFYSMVNCKAHLFKLQSKSFGFNINVNSSLHILIFSEVVCVFSVFQFWRQQFQFQQLLRLNKIWWIQWDHLPIIWTFGVHPPIIWTYELHITNASDLLPVSIHAYKCFASQLEYSSYLLLPVSIHAYKCFATIGQLEYSTVGC